MASLYKDTLPQALRQTVQQFGRKVVLDNVRLYNILNDLHAFAEYPNTLPIVKSFLQDGYAKELFDATKWWNRNDKIKQVTAGACKNLKQSPEVIRYIVDCFLYGLGKINYIPAMHTQQNVTNNSKQATPAPSTVPISKSTTTKAFFQSLISTNQQSSSVARICFCVDVVLSLTLSFSFISFLFSLIYEHWEDLLISIACAILTICLYTLLVHPYFERRLGRY